MYKLSTILIAGFNIYWLVFYLYTGPTSDPDMRSTSGITRPGVSYRNVIAEINSGYIFIVYHLVGRPDTY